MGGFLGIGGSSAKTDRSMQLAGFSNLNNVFNYALPQAEATTTSGTSDLSTAGNYYKSILSGNRSAVEQAVAPATNAARAGADAQKRQLASSGTARGGGTNAATQQANDKVMQTVDNAIFGARSDAAKGLTQVGSAEGNIGANLLSNASTTASNFTGLAGQSRSQSFAINQQVQQNVTGAIDQALTALFG